MPKKVVAILLAIKSMKVNIFLVFMACLLLIGCSKRYKYTNEICEGKLYAEVYSANPFGIDSYYLTDSLKFRKYIGRLDDEHDTYFFKCKGDNIEIIKTTRGNKWARPHTTEDGKFTVIANIDTIENLNFSLAKLQELHNIR